MPPAASSLWGWLVPATCVPAKQSMAHTQGTPAVLPQDSAAAPPVPPCPALTAYSFPAAGATPTWPLPLLPPPMFNAHDWFLPQQPQQLACST